MSICFTPCLALALVVIVLAAVGSLSPRKHHHLPHPLTLSPEIPVSLLVNASIATATVDENFVCATIDWWPEEKCNYGSCSWFHSSILNLLQDLTNPLLGKAVEALSPLLVRLGGSLQDQVVYNVGNPSVPCEPFSPENPIRFRFSQGCLNMSRWKELNEFFQKTGSVVAFGLNALYGRKRTATGGYNGPWNSSNARGFMNYTLQQGYQIKAWELGNEISGGVGLKLNPQQYAADVKELRSIINQVYTGKQKPMVVAPDGFFDYIWYSQLLQHTDETQALDAVSFHVYNLGPGDGVRIATRILNGSYNAQIYRSVQDVIKNSGAKAWVGEAGGISNGGQHLVSDTFVFSFWYLDQLGMAAFHNTAVFCRQTLIGGNYGLLDSSFKPNPDYYAALLWKKLMGEVVLNATSPSLDLHTYAHCLKDKPGGMAVLIINFSTKLQYAISFPQASTVQRLEYHLSAPDGDVQSKTVLLNGRVLATSTDGSIPTMTPIAVGGSNPSLLPPLSIAFVTIPDAFVPACTL